MLEGHTQDVKNVVRHPSESVLFSCSYDDGVAGGRCIHGEETYEARTSVGYGQTGQKLCTIFCSILFLSDPRILTFRDLSWK